MRPERMYNETKYLLFYVLKFLPKVIVYDDGNLKVIDRSVNVYMVRATVRRIGDWKEESSVVSLFLSLPFCLTHANVIKQGQIDTIAAYAHQNRDMDLLDKTKKIQHNCRKLVQDGMLSDEDNYLSLRKDIIQELLNYELHITKSTQDLDRLKQVRTESTFWI